MGMSNALSNHPVHSVGAGDACRWPRPAPKLRAAYCPPASPHGHPARPTTPYVTLPRGTDTSLFPVGLGKRDADEAAVLSSQGTAAHTVVLSPPCRGQQISSGNFRLVSTETGWSSRATHHLEAARRPLHLGCARDSEAQLPSAGNTRRRPAVSNSTRE